MSEYGHVDLETLGKQIEQTLAIADKSERNAAEKKEVAGRMLLDAKVRLFETKEMPWETFCANYCHVKRAQADLLIRIGRGDTTVEEVKGQQRERYHAHVANKKPPLANSGISQTPNILEETRAKADAAWDKAYSQLMALIQKQDTATLQRLIKELKNGK